MGYRIDANPVHAHVVCGGGGMGNGRSREIARRCRIREESREIARGRNKKKRIKDEMSAGGDFLSNFQLTTQ